MFRAFVVTLGSFALITGAVTSSHSEQEPDISVIFGDAQPGEENAASDEPDLGAIFADEPESDEPALDDIFGEAAEEEPELETVELAPPEKSPLGPRPTNVLGRIYYYLDFGPAYAQYYLRELPLKAGDFLDNELGIHTQHRKHPLELSGFIEGRMGIRTQPDKYEKQASIGEVRAQLEAHKTFEWAIFDSIKSIAWRNTTFNFRGDIYVDAVTEEIRFDLREANVEFSPFPWADMKIGRQILTWGTGDLLFINDLFPKDWKSFFIGRDVEYLKAPSDAMKMSIFTKALNLDAVWVPVFNPDRYIDGQRISYWNPVLDRRAGRDVQMSTDVPNRWFRDMEWHARAYNNIAGYEFAGYFYNGFWKSPAGFDPNSGNAQFPRLNVYGGSIRGPLWKGIANIEAGYYDSLEDRNGSDPFVNNCETRWLVGYEQSLEQFLGRTVGRDLTLGTQYYVELMMNYNRYRDSLPRGIDPREQMRQVITLRATKLLFDQNLELSMFTYFSPSDVDVYLRPHVSYKLTDYWTIDCGANIFVGKEPHTFFGQFQRDSNLYIGLRVSF